MTEKGKREISKEKRKASSEKKKVAEFWRAGGNRV